MLISAATPAAARGSESAVLRRICSLDSCEGARVIPWPPSASISISNPPRSSGSGISEISWAAPTSTPMSLAWRAHSPSGSRSRGSDGTTVSQTAVRTACCASLRTVPASSPEPIDTGLYWLPGQSLGQDEVIAMHRLLGGVREQLADLVRPQALDPAQLSGRVVDDSLADRLPVARHVDRVAGVELSLDLGDSDRQQAAAALAQDSSRPVVDAQLAVTRLRVAEP